MRQRLIMALAGGLLLTAFTASSAVSEATGEQSGQEIANINTGQEPIQSDATVTAKKPRLRFRSKTGTPKTCGASGLGEGEIRAAEQKRLQAQQQTKNSNDDSQ